MAEVETAKERQDRKREEGATSSPFRTIRRIFDPSLAMAEDRIDAQARKERLARAEQRAALPGELAKHESDYTGDYALYDDPTEGGGAKHWWTAEESRKRAGLEDDYVYDYMKDLQAKAMGTAGMAEWEKGLRHQLGEGVRGLYRDVQTAGGDRMAGRRQLSQALTSQRSRFDEAVMKRREQERLMYAERFERMKYMSKKEAEAAMQADALLEQEMQRQNEAANSAFLTGMFSLLGGAIGFIATIPAGGIGALQGMAIGSALGGGLGKAI